jgi:hypothetical protein
MNEEVRLSTGYLALEEQRAASIRKIYQEATLTNTDEEACLITGLRSGSTFRAPLHLVLDPAHYRARPDSLRYA